MLIMTSGGAVYAKDGTGDSWTQLVTSGLQDIAAGGARIMYKDGNGAACARDAFAGTSWTQVVTNGQAAKIAVGRSLSFSNCSAAARAGVRRKSPFLE